MKNLYKTYLVIGLFIFLPSLLVAGENYDVEFSVTDFSGNAIEDATITISEQTNAPGDYHFTIAPEPEDTLYYEVKKEGYMSDYGMIVDVTSDLIFKIRLWHDDMLYDNPDNNYRMPDRPMVVDSEGNYHFILTEWTETGIFPDIEVFKETHYMRKSVDQEWTTPERIHPDGMKTHFPSVAITPDDRLFVSFTREIEGDMEEKSALYRSERFTGLRPEGKEASAKNLAMVYDWESELYVAEKTAEGWEVEMLPTPTNVVNWEPQLVSDSEGNLHMTWVSTTCLDDVDDPADEDLSDYLKIAYATNASGEWEVQVLEQVELDNYGLGAFPQMAVSDDGVVHIVYRGYQPDDSTPQAPLYRVHYATNMVAGGDFWEIEMLETGKLEDAGALIAVDNTNIHIALRATDSWEAPFHTYYFHKQNMEWDEPVRLNNSYWGVPSAIVLDEDKNPVVSYVGAIWNQNENKIYFCRKEGSSFTEEKVLELNYNYLYGILQGISSNDMLYDQDGSLLMPMEYGHFKVSDEPYHRRITLLSASTMGSDDVTNTGEVIRQQTLHVFPNPATEYATLELPDHYAGEMEVRMYNMLGHLVSRKPVHKQQGEAKHIRLDVNGFPAGIYLVALQAEQGTQTFKLKVQ